MLQLTIEEEAELRRLIDNCNPHHPIAGASRSFPDAFMEGYICGHQNPGTDIDIADQHLCPYPLPSGRKAAWSDGFVWAVIGPELPQQMKPFEDEDE